MGWGSGLGALVVGVGLAVCAVVARGQGAAGVELRGPEPGTVRVGETAVLQVVWKGRGEAELVRPGRVRGLRFAVEGPSRLEQMVITNGETRRTVSTTWTIRVRPAAPGSYEVGPFRVRVGGAVRKTRRAVLRAVEDLVGKEQAFVECGVLPARAFKNQPIDVWLRVGVDVALYGRLKRVHENPNVVGLLIEAGWWDDFPAGVSVGDDRKDLPQDRPLLPVNRSLRAGGVNLGVRQRGEREFRVFEVRRRFLANRAGKFRLEPPLLSFDWAMRFERDIFGGRVPVYRSAHARGNSPRLEVVPLPEEGRPDDFRNAVGSFHLTGELSKRRMKVGEDVKLELRIEGRGNFEFLEVPDLDDLAGFHLFGKEVDRHEDHLVATYDLAALDDRQKELPAIPFSYFDPSAKPPAYVRAGVGPIPIEVLPIPGGKGLAPLPDARKALTPGIDDIWDRLPVDGKPPRPFRPEPWLTWTTMLVPFVVFLLGWLVARRRAFLRAHPAVVRSRQALDRFGSRLGSEGPLRALSVYLADRLGWEEGEAVRRDLADRLRDAGVPPELATRTEALVGRLLESRYGGPSGEDGLADEAATLARDFDRMVGR